MGDKCIPGRKVDEARAYLKTIFKPEYSTYINERLAGDFAVEVAEKLKADGRG